MRFARHSRCPAIEYGMESTQNALTMPSCRLRICCSVENLPAPTALPRRTKLHPFVVLFNIDSRWTNLKAFTKSWIRSKESLHRHLIARGHSPLSIFAYQVLLHDDFPFGLNRINYSSIQYRIHHREIACYSHGPNVESIQHVHVLSALQCVCKAIARHTGPRGTWQDVIETAVVTCP